MHSYESMWRGKSWVEVDSFWKYVHPEPGYQTNGKVNDKRCNFLSQMEGAYADGAKKLAADLRVQLVNVESIIKSLDWFGLHGLPEVCIGQGNVLLWVCWWW